MKKLESGPTEAELRRRRLIEIDQDEMEDRIERINRVALKAISSATGWTAEEQLKQVCGTFSVHSHCSTYAIGCLL